MQVPSTISGLRQVLRSLGYGDVLAGVDADSSDAKGLCKQQIDYLFSEGAQTAQDVERRRKAISFIERYPWDGARSDGMLGLSASAAGAYISRESRKNLVYYGPYADLDEAFIVDAMSSPDAVLLSSESTDDTVSASDYDDGELSYYMDHPGAIGFRAVTIRRGDKIPIDSWYTRAVGRRPLAWRDIERVISESGGTKEGFLEWCRSARGAGFLRAAADPLSQVVDAVEGLKALLEEDQRLVPKEVLQVTEGDDGKTESIVVEDWSDDEADMLVAAARLLKDVQ